MTRAKKYLIGGGAAAVAVLLLLLSVLGAHISGIAQAQEEQENSQRACGPDAQGAQDNAQVAQQVRAVLAGTTNSINAPGLTLPTEQIPNAKIIIATGIQLHIPARGQVIALATALQESTLRNLTGGDRDSLGLFQQRPSQGWGTRSQILDPVYASTTFYRALTSVPGWQTMPLAQAAQRVQKSGVPGAYAKHETLATALQRAIAPTLGPPTTPPDLLRGAYGASTCTPSATGTDYGQIPPGTLPAGYQVPPTTTPAARSAITWALQQLGTPYQWGGTCTNPHGDLPRDRCDCSSLVQRAYGVAGIPISRVTYTQIHDGRPAPLRSPQPGDLLFTEGQANHPEHVVMAIGDGLVVQAPRPGRVVDVVKISSIGPVLVARRIA